VRIARDGSYAARVDSLNWVGGTHAGSGVIEMTREGPLIRARDTYGGPPADPVLLTVRDGRLRWPLVRRTLGGGLSGPWEVELRRSE
jgi:hypothetical protein